MIFPSLFQTCSKIKEQNKTNKQRQQQKPYLFLDHDSRDSRTLFYLSFKRPKSKPNLRQTGFKTIPFGPTHEGVTAPIPRPEPGQGPMGCKLRGLKAIEALRTEKYKRYINILLFIIKAISFTSPLQVTFGNLHRKN